MQNSACTICAQEHIVVANIAQTQVNVLSKLISATSSTILVNDNGLISICIVCAMELLRLQKFLSMVEKSRTILSSVHEDKMICKAEPEDDDLQNFDCYDNGKVDMSEEARAAEIESVFVMDDHRKYDDFVIKSEEVIVKEERDEEIVSSSAMDIPEEISLEALEANGKLWLGKGKFRYQQELKFFNEWRKAKAVGVLNETVMLAYVSTLLKRLRASSVYTKFCKLRKVLILNGDVDVLRYKKVEAFIKSQYISHTPKQPEILSIEQCQKFILEASDEFLFCKVVLIFGLYGACHLDELLNITVDDIEDHGKYILVKIQQFKALTFTSFIIPDSSESWNPYGICRKYFKLRPLDVRTSRLFLIYRRGKCVAQPAGMHTIGCVPRKVAEFFCLDHPERYTFCFRRSGDNTVAESCGQLNESVVGNQSKPLQCDKCLKCFSSKGHLGRHQLTHTGLGSGANMEQSLVAS